MVYLCQQGIETRRYYQQMTRFSAAFALSADIAMAALGGTLKRREKVSARLGDVLSLMYLCSATLKRFEDDGRPAEDLPLLHWAMQDALYKIQQAFEGVTQNFPNALVRGLLSALIFPLGQAPVAALGSPRASDRDAADASRRGTRSPDCRNVHSPRRTGCNWRAGSSVSQHSGQCEPLQAKLEEAHKAGKLKARHELLRISEARDNGLIDAEQALQLERDYALRRKVIMVDDFAPEELRAAG